MMGMVSRFWRRGEVRDTWLIRTFALSFFPRGSGNGDEKGGGCRYVAHDGSIAERLVHASSSIRYLHRRRKGERFGLRYVHDSGAGDV